MRQFVESIKRLYVSEKLTEGKVIELFKSGKITENEKSYILEVNQAL